MQTESVPMMGSAYKPIEKKVVVFTGKKTVEFSEREAEEIHQLLGAALNVRSQAQQMAQADNGE